MLHAIWISIVLFQDIWIALVEAIGTIVAAAILAVVGAKISNRYAKEREETIRRKEWIDQAIELTKLDVERKIHNASLEHPREDERLRPPILDFLAYYRDLMELEKDDTTPAILYERIRTKRMSTRSMQSEETQTESQDRVTAEE